MKEIETGKDKVKKICDLLRKDTLDPAMEEAADIVEKGKQRAEQIVLEAEAYAEQLKTQALDQIQREKNVFDSSLGQACKQALFALKQEIETKLLDEQLFSLLTKHTKQPQVLADLISAVVKGIEKEGLSVNLSVYVPAEVPAGAVNELLAHATLQRLKEKSVLIGSMSGGIEIALHEEKVTIDLTDKALKDLVAGYTRKSFRTMILGSES